jgi:hypothetical protein
VARTSRGSRSSKALPTPGAALPRLEQAGEHGCRLRPKSTSSSRKCCSRRARAARAGLGCAAQRPRTREARGRGPSLGRAAYLTRRSCRQRSPSSRPRRRSPATSPQTPRRSLPRCTAGSEPRRRRSGSAGCGRVAEHFHVARPLLAASGGALDRRDGEPRTRGRPPKEGKLEEAIQLLRDTTARYPDAILAQLTLGRYLLQSQRLAEAEAAFRRAVAIAPSSFEARYELAGALQAQQRVAEAAASSAPPRAPAGVPAGPLPARAMPPLHGRFGRSARVAPRSGALPPELRASAARPRPACSSRRDTSGRALSTSRRPCGSTRRTARPRSSSRRCAEPLPPVSQVMCAPRVST